MNVTGTVYMVLLVGLMAAIPASAKDKDKPGRGNKGRGAAAEQGDDKSHPGRPVAAATFSDEERQTIRYYVEHFGQQEGKHPLPLPPGLAKKVARGGKLPPGWQDKCVRGEIMSVPVYEQCRPLPPELTVRLPVPPVGTVTVAVGGKVARVLEATREILDVFDVHVRF